MPSSAPFGEPPCDAPTIETAQLEELRERLMLAQRNETLANRALNEFTAENEGRGSASFAELLAKVQVARDQTRAVYEEWERTAKAFNGTPPRDPGQSRTATPRDQEGFDASP